MRWESLFDDLEAQAEAQERLALETEVGDLARAERAAITLVERLRSHRGAPLRIRLVDGATRSVLVEDVGADCLLTREPDGPHGVVGRAAPSRALVPLAAVVSVEGLGRGTDPGRTSSERRLGLAAALRRVARDRATLRLELRDGSALTGTVDRVAADHLELAAHPADVTRHPGNVTGAPVVPFVALVRAVLI